MKMLENCQKADSPIQSWYWGFEERQNIFNFVSPGSDAPQNIIFFPRTVTQKKIIFL